MSLTLNPGALHSCLAPREAHRVRVQARSWIFPVFFQFFFSHANTLPSLHFFMSGAKKIYVGIRRCGNKHCAPGHCACMLGLFARKGFTCQKGDWVASYGPVKPVLFSVLRKKYRQFVRYATIIPKDMAKEYGLAKPSPDDDWFLIPDVTTKGVYVFGDKCPRRPTEHLNDAVGLDGTHLGALFNTRLPGEQAHVTWTVTPPSSTNGAQWGVDFFAVRYMKPKEGITLRLWSTLLPRYSGCY